MDLKNNSGYILITVLLLLLVLTVIGIAAIGTSTIENSLSGNMRLRERNVSKADAGVNIAMPLIARAVRENDLVNFTNIINPVFPATDANYLPSELRSRQFDPDTQDVAFTVADINPAVTQTITVDIDNMYTTWIEGSAMEFAAGYEGLGKGAGAGGFYTYYRVNATSNRTDSGNPMAAAQVGAMYRYVPK